MSRNQIPRWLYRWLDGMQSGPWPIVWWLIRLRWPWCHYCNGWDGMVIGHTDELLGCGCERFNKWVTIPTVEELLETSAKIEDIEDAIE